MTINYINNLITVSGEFLFDDMWKKMRSSPAIMYDTPYPSSATGPNPPETKQM